MSEELKPKIEALRQATIDITPYYPYLQHDISDIVYDHFSDEVQAGASAEYTQLAVNLAPALVRGIDELQAENERLVSLVENAKVTINGMMEKSSELRKALESAQEIIDRALS
jgi:hypothetical protein